MDQKKDSPSDADKKPSDAPKTDESGLPAPENLDVDTTQDSAPPPGANQPAAKKKDKGGLKKVWDKFNLYLILFVLLLVIAGAAVAILVTQGKNAAKQNTGQINAQNLSANALKQLAASGVAVGSPNQVLNVESSAVFDGTVLVRNNLEVAGSLQVSDNLSLPSITVTGVATLTQIAAQNLALSGPASIQGLLTAKNGIAVNGDGSFTGTVTTANLVTNNLQLNGNLVFTHHITAGGQIPGITQGSGLGSGGTASLSGSDTAGSLTVNIGGSPTTGCFATIKFTQAFSTTPHVVVTPIGLAAGGLAFYVNRSAASMSICTASIPQAGSSFAFDYIIFD